MVDIECISGTFEATAWHVGKHVAANPSGFNWRLDGDDIDIALGGLRTEGQAVFVGPRQLVVMSNLPDRVIIKALDTAIHDERTGRTTILSAAGREQFIAVLEKAATQPGAGE